MNTKKILLYFSVLLLISVFILKFFFIFTVILGSNSAFFASRNDAINHGQVLHTGNLSNNKGPLTVYALSFFSIFFGLTTDSINLLAFLEDFALLLAVFFISRKYFGLNKALIASTIYSVLSISFNAAHYDAEFPCTLFGLLGVFLYFLFLEKNNKYNLFFAGLLIGISIWFKQPGFFFFLAILIHQIYLYFKKKETLTRIFGNILIVFIGIMTFSIPLLIYFLHNTGFNFLKDMILFNLSFNTGKPRIFTIGRLSNLVLRTMGFLFIIILASPKKQESERDAKIISFLIIYSVIMILFFMINREIMAKHMIQLAVPLILLAIFCYKKYPEESLKIIRILLIISLLSVFMFSLEKEVRNYLQNEGFKQEQITLYIKNEIPKGSLVYSVNEIYNVLGGYENPYRWTAVSSHVASVDNFSDFCGFIDNVDYVIFNEEQKKYLGEKNLECAYSKFEVIKDFEEIGSDVTILRKSEDLSL